MCVTNRGYHMMAMVLGVALQGCLGRGHPLDMATTPADAVGLVTATPDNFLIAVGGTGQIGLSVASLTGTPLTTFDSVVYMTANATDTLTVRVDRTGLVTGRAPTAASIPVNVLAFHHRTFNGDQILVTVTPTAVPGLTLSIQPPAGDSTKLAAGTAKTITPVLRNPTTGQNVMGVGLQYAVQPQDEERVGVFIGTVGLSGHAALSPAAARNQIVPYVFSGSAWIYARVNAYGAYLQDSVQYTFTHPYTGSVRISKSNLAVQTVLNAGDATAAAVNADIILQAGATVTFTNGVGTTDPLTAVFTFDNPAAATVATPPSPLGGTTGNVTTLTGGQGATRRFLTPGTYHWTWAVSGGPAPWTGQSATGAIIIK